MMFPTTIIYLPSITVNHSTFGNIKSPNGATSDTQIWARSLVGAGKRGVGRYPHSRKWRG